MKTADAEKMFLTTLGKNITSVLGGKIFSSHGKNGFIIERTNKFDNIFQRFELKKIQNEITKETYFFIEIIVGELDSHKIENFIRMKGLKNLYITLPNLLKGEEKKITLLTLEKGRFTIIDFDDKFKIFMMSGIDRRKNEPEGKTHEKRRKFVEL
ncbi:hypothetical protein DRQ09_05320 [candidate division KSB1 bacterium]|nr:MAG: hypothetical protein DRQ09_05320 [candidate division KSB1 bacterium]